MLEPKLEAARPGPKLAPEQSLGQAELPPKLTGTSDGHAAN